MDIVVSSDARTRHRGRLRAGALDVDCALGRAGITRNKREGDGATPAGRYPLRSVLYREDRIGTLASGLPVRAIAPEDGWCDDPARGDYNRAVRLPIEGSAEALWREDDIYDVIVVIGHNDDPPVAGAGSAIFLHVAREGYAPTEGCVAIDRDALIALVQEIKPGDAIVIGAAE